MPLTRAEISHLRELREKKHREERGLFVIEGAKVVGEMIATGFPFIEIYATPAWTARHEIKPALAIKNITAEEMSRLSHYPTPSTILAVGRIERKELPPGALNSGLTLALDGLQDPGNVGTLLRIADWFGLDRVLLSPDCADLFSQKVINASMGSFARVAVHTAILADALASTSVPVLGCDLAGEDVHLLPPLRNAVIVLGAEGHGISPGTAARLTGRITIPRFGGAESLNAAVAAAIVCDNLRRAGR